MGDWWARMCCRCLLKWPRYPLVREGSDWGLPRGCRVVWCAVGECSNSLMWPRGTHEGKTSEWKRHPTHSTKNGPWASRFCSASEERVCCSEACPFEWFAKISLYTCGELKWSMTGESSADNFSSAGLLQPLSIFLGPCLLSGIAQEMQNI